MSTVRMWALGALWAGAAACAAPGYVQFPDSVPALEPRAGGAATETDEASLGERPTLAAVVRLARVRNPELLAARARAEAAFARIPGAGRLPDLELKIEIWGAPLARPWALEDSDTIMLGVRQAFPAAGVRGAESDAFAEEARAAAATLRATELDVVRDAEQAWAAYELADRALTIHRDHIEVASRLVEVATTLISSGRATQDDVLRLDLERARLHRDVVRFERDRRTASVKLNALMGRDSRAPLGTPPPDAPPPVALPSLASLEQGALERRPELAAASHRLRAGKARTHARQREARWPSFMVGADYWLMPDGPVTNGYGLMLSVNLPWLNGARGDSVRVAEAETRVDEREATGLRTQVLAEVGEAYAGVEAARRSLAIVDEDLMPRAERAFEASRSSFATGRGSTLAILDALRAWLDLRMERAVARVELDVAWSELERASGGEVTP